MVTIYTARFNTETLHFVGAAPYVHHNESNNEFNNESNNEYDYIPTQHSSSFCLMEAQCVLCEEIHFSLQTFNPLKPSGHYIYHKV